MAKYTNTLRSHSGESSSHREDKMSGTRRVWMKEFKGKSKALIKKFHRRKIRMMQKDKSNYLKLYGYEID